VTSWPDLLSEIDLSTAGVGPARASLLVKYLTLLHKWTSVTNLVATSTSPRDLVRYHLADSLALVLYLGEGPRLVDVGSGGGLPGVVLAIARPNLSVTALEPVHKKQAFLATVRRELPLDNFVALAERDDSHRRRPDFHPYDVAVSRAAFHIDDWLARATNLIRPGGRILAMEGRERHPLPPGARRHPYRLDDRDRAIIEWSP
jgi:16S rRNA (guanine527-N7)-methyltransferase